MHRLEFYVTGADKKALTRLAGMMTYWYEQLVRDNESVVRGATAAWTITAELRPRRRRK